MAQSQAERLYLSRSLCLDGICLNERMRKMFRFPLRFLRTALAGGALLLIATAPASMATAAPPRSTKATTAVAHPSVRAAGARAVGHVHLNVPNQGTHFLYVDNGLAPDSISGYQISSSGLTPTPGSPYATSSTDYLYAFGENQIAISTANGPCLFHSDAAGKVESFTINPTTGALTLASAIGLGVPPPAPGDLHVSVNGLYVYVSLWGPPSYIDVLTVGSGCALTTASQTENANASYISFVLLGNNGLMAVDYQNSQLDVYGITQGTQLKLATTTASQLYEPAGAAAVVGVPPQQTLVFTGGDGAQAYTVSQQGALTPVAGSPAEDPCWCSGANVFYDRANSQLVVAEQTSLGIYGLANNTMTFLSQVPLASGDYAPSAMTELGSELYVVNSLSNTVDACAMAAGSASCVLAATLPTGGYPQGIGVF
jgi:hypothetical protein